MIHDVLQLHELTYNIKDVAGQLRKLRRAEARRKKQRERRKANKSFKSDPFRTLRMCLVIALQLQVS